MSHTMFPHSAPAESIGFRPPQFSDDVAWLPEWLQPDVSAMTSNDKEEEGSQNPGGCSVKMGSAIAASAANPVPKKRMKASQFRGSKCRDKDPYSEMVKDTRKECTRLHLSGDDESPMPGTACREKVLLFTLHLSTDGSSGSRYFPMIDSSQDDRLTSIEQSVEDVQRTDYIKQSKMERNLCNMRLFYSTCYQNKCACPSSQPRRNPQDARQQSLPKPNSKNSEDHEISDAVELSTSASEALVIHELIKGESSSDALSTTTILELALQVKQTRLMWLNDALAFSNSDDRVSRSDGLSDLDDSEMEDAYRDVGLSLSMSPNICTKSTSVSQVAETSISRQHFVEDDGTTGSKQQCQENSNGAEKQECQENSNGAEKQVEMLEIDLAVDTAGAKKESLVMNDDHLDLLPSIACGDDLMSRQLHQRNSDEITLRQQEDASGGSKLKRIKHFREKFTLTSNFSESADDVPDLNSCVRRCERSLKISQSSINIESLCRTGNNEPLLSHDIAKDSILSSVDPLCSVIPCSISSRTQDFSSAHFHNDEHHNGYKMVIPEFDLEAQNMHSTSCPNEIVYSKKQDKTAANSLDFYLNSRHAAPAFLDAYSMQSPSWQPCLHQNDPNVVQAEQAEDAIDARSLSCQQNTSTANSLPNGCLQAAENVAELQISLTNEVTMPHILCHRARHRVLAHKHHILTQNEKELVVDESSSRFDPSRILQDPHIQHGKFPDACIPTKKRVRFNDKDLEYQKQRESLKLTPKYRSRKISSSGKRKHPSDQQHCWSSQEVKAHLTNFDTKDKKKPIFQGLDFLLTGLPCKKEKEVERILRRYGGAVLAEIPTPQKRGIRKKRSDSVQLPIVICTKKLRTRKFLYGCAVRAFLLQVDWVIDSIEASSVLRPEKYLVLPTQQNRRANRILKPIHLRTVDLMFCKVGIMLHGEPGFCLKLAEVIKHGQGCVYKSLQGMVQNLKNKNISVGIIIADHESYATRHLRKCASEQRIPVMSTSWIINCIYSGKLLPFKENNSPPRSTPIEIRAISASQEWSQEI